MALNNKEFPFYYKHGRVIPLSKKRGHKVVRLEEVRPIVVKSHLTKIMERAIINKIKVKESSWHLLKTKRYLSGFKQEQGTSVNLTNVIERIANSWKNNNKEKMLIF